jgi:pimeloyl-[acyl-carrier protein] methyl ester esterase
MLLQRQENLEVSTTTVLLHGWGFTPRIWQGIAPELGCNVIAPLLMPDYPTLESWALALAKTLPPQSVLVGWSLGAMLALQLAHVAPDSVCRLVLISATPRMTQADDWPHGMKAQTFDSFVQTYIRDPHKLARRFLALQTLGDEAGHALADQLTACMADMTDTKTTLLQGLHLLGNTDLRLLKLPENLPVTLIHGRNDALMPVSAAQSLHSCLPGSVLHIIENAGHAPLLTQPKALAALIRGRSDA